MRYVSTSNLSTRALEWVPIHADDTQPNHEGKVSRWSAVDLAGVYRDAERYARPVRCPVSGWKHGSTLQDPNALYDRLMRS